MPMPDYRRLHSPPQLTNGREAKALHVGGDVVEAARRRARSVTTAPQSLDLG